jgi:hypothetical protein
VLGRYVPVRFSTPWGPHARRRPTPNFGGGRALSNAAGAAGLGRRPRPYASLTVAFCTTPNHGFRYCRAPTFPCRCSTVAATSSPRARRQLRRRHPLADQHQPAHQTDRPTTGAHPATVRQSRTHPTRSTRTQPRSTPARVKPRSLSGPHHAGALGPGGAGAPRVPHRLPHHPVHRHSWAGLSDRRWRREPSGSSVTPCETAHRREKCGAETGL